MSDLNKLWTGVRIGGETTCAALIAVRCDLPAAQKIAGSLSYSANSGCSRCYCESTHGFGNNYSGFDRRSCTPRSETLLRKCCRTSSYSYQNEKKESEFGCRYSFSTSMLLM